MRLFQLFFFLLILAGNIFAGELVMLKNGVSLITEKRDYTKTLSITVMIKGGMFRESSMNYGIGDLFASVWLKSNNILKNIEFLGGSVGASSSYDYTEVGVSIISEFADRMLVDLDRFFNNPEFSQKVFDVEKNIQLNRIKNLKDNANSVAAKGFNMATYGDFVYSQETMGTKETVSSLTLDDIKRYYSDIMKGEDFIVSIAGNYNDSILKEIVKIFEKIPAGKSHFNLDCEKSIIKDDKYVLEDYDRIKQAKLYIAYTAPSAGSRDYLAIKLLSDILGGGMSSKYFNILRKEKGYAYSVGSYYPSRICNSRFVAYIGLQYSNVKDAIETIDGINKNIKNYITEDDIKYNKNYILGKILSEAQTNSKISWYNAFFTNLGLGAGYLSKYIEGIKGLSMDDLVRVSEIFHNPKTIYVLKPSNE
ncbi:MAG: insulinase family protein [Calditerrivibrio sp.]|nr:insulinase family protein [Calditerrivibrio sp.]MCA1980704.1 insulinase family protein [Calditerrivibrio sp.]